MRYLIPQQAIAKIKDKGKQGIFSVCELKTHSHAHTQTPTHTHTQVEGGEGLLEWL